MFTQICRGTLSLRALKALETKTVSQISPFVNKCNLHYTSCHARSRLSIAALHPQPQYTSWITKRFRTKPSHLQQDTPEDAKAMIDQPRSPRRRNKALYQTDAGYPVAAFSTAEEYNLENFKVAIGKQQLYSVVEEDQVFKVQECDHKGEDVVHIKALYNVNHEPREVFFFREGTAVFWNVSDLEISNFLRFIRPFEKGRYNEKLVMSEREVLSYVHGEGKKTLFRNDIIEIGTPADSSLEKYSFSNGIALSVKLGIWEASLTKFISSIEFISEDLKVGRKIRMTREEVLRKQGELFALRHSINLSSDLLDTPDFYWDNEELEKLYLQTVNYFCISRRTKVMNEKINHCGEMVELVSSHLSDKHHVRLEWMIIVLIMVEVGFEFLHYIGS